MAGQRMKARDKKIQRMTKDGLVEENLADKSAVRVSRRMGDLQMGSGKAKGEKEPEFGNREKGGSSPKAGQPAGKPRDAPETEGTKRKIQKRRIVRQAGESVPGQPPDKNGHDGGRLREKHADLALSRGDARKRQTGGSKKPGQKQRLRFAYEETGEAQKDEASAAKLNKMDAEGINFRHDAGKRQSQKAAEAKERERKAPKKHSMREKVYQENGEDAAIKKKKRLKFEEETEVTAPSAGKAGRAALTSIHRQVRKNDDDNAAVEGANNLAEGAEGVSYLNRRSVRRKKRKDSRTTGYQTKKMAEAGAETSVRQERSHLKKLIQKQRIKRDYAKAKQGEQAMGTAVVGTVDYIKKIGGKVTNFFKENQKVYISIAALIGMMFLIMTSVTSCSSAFVQSLINYTGTSYISSDEAIRQTELYYTQLEADLQARINRMETEEPGYDEYRYNIGPIEHDPFILISYLSAKYEEFTFEQVKPELDALFALQYRLETEAVNETVTETATVRVGESLGSVVTSGYCNCPVCCGIWSGGPTASGAYPTANHTLAVDASNPFVPMGTKVVMNGVEYTVEDTGAFARYGVQFDVYYGSHAEASAHGHQTWECYLADDNGSQEVEVTRTREVDVLNVTLNAGSLAGICRDRLGFFQRELFDAYNETKGNLQMFGTPFDFNWYYNVSSYYGYRVHPISGADQLHNGLDIGVPEGTKVLAGLTGTVTDSAYNDSYGNYIVIKDSRGYELRYAHLQSRSVSAGTAISKGDEVGLAGSTGDSTGSHLHLELLKGGERMNPIFYMETGEGSIFGGNEYTSEAAQRLLQEAARYLGTPYVWGGYSPSGFDCSGFVSYCLTNSGVRNTGRLTAQGLYNVCTPVAESDVQPGDLVFFTGTYDAGEPVTHIGIYVGGGQMIHCGHPVQYTSIYSPYWQGHFYGFGRW